MEDIPDDILALFPPSCRPGLLVLDDLLKNCSDDERILDLFTRVTHYDVTCVYLTQVDINLDFEKRLRPLYGEARIGFISCFKILFTIFDAVSKQQYTFQVKL